MEPELADIFEKVEAGESLSFDDGVSLFRSQDIFAIGRMANPQGERLNGRMAKGLAELCKTGSSCGKIAATL